MPTVPTLTTLPASTFQLEFTEVVSFRGDFGGTEVVNPKGIAYHPDLNQLIVSISPFTPPNGQRVQILNTVQADGARARFASDFKTFRDVESLIAIVPPAGPPVTAGFVSGDVFVGRGPEDQISRLSKDGKVIQEAFAELNSGAALWGGLAFDTEGAFGGRLIAATTTGKLFLIASDGTGTLLTDVAQRLEGVAIAPNDFGPYAGRIIVGVEGFSDTDPESGRVYAIDNTGNRVQVADIGFAAEDIQFVPPRGGTYYQAELSFDRERENRILTVSSSQFLGRRGRMVVVNELAGEIHEVVWNGIRLTQSLIGRVPGRWTSHGFAVQGTELEAGCFAARPPILPAWTSWSAIPGNVTTDRSIAGAVDSSSNLHLLVKGADDSRVYHNKMLKTTGVWTGWSELPPGTLTTDHALAIASHNTVVYAFAVRSDGAILFKRLFAGNDTLLTEPWTEVPGEGRTDAAVAAATSNGRLVLCAKGFRNQELFLNELAPGGRSWSGWSVIPGGGQTDLSPALVSFQDELYVFIKAPKSGRILTKVRSTSGHWTDWAELPGEAVTDAPIAAVPARNQLFVFAKGVNKLAPQWNVASDTGTWSSWQAIPQGGQTDTSLGVTTISDRIYLFAKRIRERKIYMRYTN